MIKRTTRRVFLASAAAAIGGAAYTRYAEPNWLDLTYRSCPIRGLKNPVTFAHISDLHASIVVENTLIERAIDMVVGLKPSFIAITGDFVTAKNGYDRGWYIETLRRLSKAAPSYATFGNHDGGAWVVRHGGFETSKELRDIVREAGIRDLHNRAERTDGLNLVGVGDVWAMELSPKEAFAGIDSAPAVVLSHNPDTKSFLWEYPWQLMLSGHTHGGQVVMPITGLSPAPVHDRRYVAGMKAWRDRWIHVSRGVGNAYGVRFNCRPEVTMVTLTPA